MSELSKTDRMRVLRENGRKPVHITSTGRMFIGGDEFLYPVGEGTIKVERVSGRNLLTLTLVVGDVTMDNRKPRASCSNPECGVTFSGPSACMPTHCDHCGSFVYTEAQ
jgi:hypothetical protein